MKKALLVGSLLTVGAFTAWTTSPKLNSTTPAGAQRGTQLTLSLNGARLDDAPEIVFTGPGLKVLKIDSIKTNVVKATIQIAPNCPAGEHQLRVRTASGVSDLRTFWVSTTTNLNELEPNNERAKAQRVPLGCTINGTAGGEDTDYFRVEARKGDRISAEVEAIRLGRAMLDPYLAIHDADGKALVSADDTTLLAQDSAVSILAPKDGVYYIEMRDGTYSGTETAYRLHLGNFPRPMMIYPLGGKAGETISFKFLGDPVGEFSQSVKLPAAPDDKFGIFARDIDGTAPSPNWVRVSSFASESEVEPNDKQESATKYDGPIPIAFNGIISKKKDVDYFKFPARKNQALDINVYARRLRSPLDSALEILDAKGVVIASNEDGAGADSVLKFAPPEDGEYYLRIRDQFENGGPEFIYRIEVTPQIPIVTLSIPQVARNDSQTRQYITVPRGGRFATMISAKRANFSGDLLFQAEDLPVGVRLVADKLPAKQELEPLVFEAAADAPITGKFVELVAQSTDTAKPIHSNYRHGLEFISGPNNTYYYTAQEEKLYVAVCEAAPFSIRIEEPQAPLVQYGSLDLKIVAERSAGFDEPINVKMMWNPPGVGSLPDITIPKGKNSAVYALNAKADAEVRSWKIAVLGSATVKGGPLFLSSQLATLETAEPFVVGTVAPVSVSPGQEAKLICKLDQRKPFAGKARVRVLGLPEKMTAAEAEITSNDKEVVIKLTVDATVPLASYRNFLCAADVVHNGQVIPHNLANGAVIRVVPPKKGAIATKQVAQKDAKSQ